MRRHVHLRGSLADDVDPIIVQAIADQPDGATPLPTVRAAILAVDDLQTRVFAGAVVGAVLSVTARPDHG
jgi:hypothetical protein